MSAHTALAGRIRASLLELKKVVDRALELGMKAQTSGDEGYWDGVALNLHGFYTGAERIFEDIARSVEMSLPTGPDWHSDLLIQMSSEVSAARPAVIHPETRRCLDDYRGFRHVVRNVYTLNLRPARVKELTDGLPDCYEMFSRDLLAFATFLEQVD